MKSIDIIFNGPPGLEGGRYLEARDSETDKAVGIDSIWGWLYREDGLCALRIPLSGG